MKKEFRFDDDSKALFEFSDNGSMSITLQAKHLGKDFKITSSNVTLSSDNVYDLANWIAKVLIEKRENG